MNDACKWKSWSPFEASDLLRNVGKDFWIAGGWAIDLFLKRTTRLHDDLDVAIDRNDQVQFYFKLKDFDLMVPDPPGMGILRPLNENEILKQPLHNVWVGKNEWKLELLLCDFENNEWVYRRNKNIRGSRSEFGWEHESGLKVISPEIQLLYKAANPRAKDEQDFRNCLPEMSLNQKERLEEYILLTAGAAHPWISLLR